MKLAAPLRVTWDWSWPPAAGLEKRGRVLGKRRLRDVGGELARARVLLLEIGYPGPADFQEGLFAEVAGDIGGHLSLVVTPKTIAALDGREETWEGDLQGEVWADVTPLAGSGEGSHSLPLRRDGSVWHDLRIYLTSSNWREGALIVREAAERGAKRLSLPILPLFGSFLEAAETQIPTWSDLVEFADLLEPVFHRFPDFDIRVHYQSLWMLLAERGVRAAGDEAPGNSGCQAGAALAYIDPEGVLYPCSAFPVPIGRVGEGVIESVWGGEECRRLRQSIDIVPSFCEGRECWRVCRGGCRGWAHYVSGTWSEPGPDCGKAADGPGCPL